MDPLSWTTDLSLSGTHYEGWVGDTDKVLQLHSQESVPSYGLQKPTKASGCTAEERQCQIEDMMASCSPIVQYIITKNGGVHGITRMITWSLTEEMNSCMHAQS